MSERYEFTGDFRQAMPGEYYLTVLPAGDGNPTIKKAYSDTGKVLIFRRLDEQQQPDPPATEKTEGQPPC